MAFFWMLGNLLGVNVNETIVIGILVEIVKIFEQNVKAIIDVFFREQIAVLHAHVVLDEGNLLGVFLSPAEDFVIDGTHGLTAEP